MWTADNTINVIILILLGANVRKIQFFFKNFMNSMSEYTRLGFLVNFFSNNIHGCTRLSSNHSPGSESWGKSPVPTIG